MTHFKSTRFIQSGLLLTIIALFAFALSLINCGGGGASAAGTVKSYMAAMKKGDLKKAFSYVEDGEQMYEMTKSMGNDAMNKEMAKMSKKMSYKIIDENIEGDNASVKVELKMGDDATTQKFKLKMIKGEWLITSGF
jgi:Domain of unknown function (DUF4878)